MSKPAMDQWSPSPTKVLMAAKKLDPRITIDPEIGERILFWVEANDIQLDDLLGGYFEILTEDGTEEIKAFSIFKVRETPFHIWSYHWVDQEYNDSPNVKVLFESTANLLGRLQYDAFQRQEGKQAFPENWIMNQDLKQLAVDIEKSGGPAGYADFLFPDYVQNLIIRQASKQTNQDLASYQAALEAVVKHFGGKAEH